MTRRLETLCTAAATTILLVLAAVLPSVSSAQEGDSANAAADTAAGAKAAVASSEPSLTCTGRSLPIMVPGVQGMALSCTVAGAPPSDTGFALRAVLGRQDGTGRTIDPLCTGSLTNGMGTCRGSFIDQSEAWRGGLVISGTLSPSSGPLGPFTLGQAAPAAAAALGPALDGRDVPAPPAPSTVQNGGPSSEGSTPTSEAGATDADWSVACGVPTTGKTAPITLGEAGVAVPCIVVSAGDLLTWLNPTAAPVVIQAPDDQFATKDVSATFSSVEVPAHGQVTVRVIHAGRIQYTAPDHPEISGTILVLGRGAA